jgi:hypothetical protein
VSGRKLIRIISPQVHLIVNVINHAIFLLENPEQRDIAFDSSEAIRNSVIQSPRASNVQKAFLAVAIQQMANTGTDIMARRLSVAKQEIQEEDKKLAEKTRKSKTSKS